MRSINNLTLTICIPTWNRGPVALRQVLRTLPLIDPDWEILVLDNDSNLFQDEYKEIEKMSYGESSVRYIKNERDLGFAGNFLSCFGQARSPYIQIISDEDFSHPPTVRDALTVFKEYPDLGALRGSIGGFPGESPRNMLNYPNSFLRAGDDALCDFSLATNYLSGMIYNRSLLSNLGLPDRVKSALVDNIACATYPHLYLDILVASACDVATVAEVVCFEGPEMRGSETLKQLAQSGAYSFSARLDQFVGFRDLFREICDGKKLGLLIFLYMRLVRKYYHMFHCDISLHQTRGLNIIALHESLTAFFWSATNIPEFVNYADVIRDEFDKAVLVSKRALNI